MGTLRPLARCAPPALTAAQRKLGAKHETRRRIVALWPDLTWRQRARKLRVSEGTLRGQLDTRVMNRAVTRRVLDPLEWHEEIARLSAKIGAVG